MPIIKEAPLSGYPSSFSSVKNEVQEGIHEDRKYKRVDNQKKKAIYSASCYDDFKDLVSTCHLQPIKMKEFKEPIKGKIMEKKDEKEEKDFPSLEAVTISEGEEEGYKKFVEFEKDLLKLEKNTKKTEKNGIFEEKIIRKIEKSVGLTALAQGKSVDSAFISRLFVLLSIFEEKNKNENHFIVIFSILKNFLKNSKILEMMLEKSEKEKFDFYSKQFEK